jgi:hypothetical protein
MEQSARDRIAHAAGDQLAASAGSPRALVLLPAGADQSGLRIRVKGAGPIRSARHPGRTTSWRR